MYVESIHIDVISSGKARVCVCDGGGPLSVVWWVIHLMGAVIYWLVSIHIGIPRFGGGGIGIGYISGD